MDLVNNLRGVFDYVIEEKRNATPSAATSAAATASAVPRADEGSSTAVASASLRLLIDAAVNSEVAVEMISETPNKSHK